MDVITQLQLFTLFTGTAAISSEILSYYKSQKDKSTQNKLIDKNDIKNILGSTGIQLAKDIQLKEKYDYEGSVIFGSTGTGKSTGFFIPNLLNDDIRGSIVVMDPKAELFKLTSSYQKNVCGRNVLKFSPLEPLYSESYNLLIECKKPSEVLELASSLLFNGGLSIELATGKKTGGAEWIQMSESLFAAALFYVKELEFPFNTIEFAFKILITLNTNELDLIFSKSNQDCVDQWNIFKMVGGADRTEGSIKITLSSNLKIFSDIRINQVSNESTFNFEDMRKKETILYICYPENKANYIAPFTAAFFSQMLDTFINVYSESSLQVHIFADEFANIGMITNMSTIISTIRSRKISMNICLQSLTQLSQIYGVHNAKAILNNLKTKIIYPALSDEETLNYISNLCGEKQVEISNRSESKNGTNMNYSKQLRKLLSQSNIRCLNDNEILIILSNKMPLIALQNTYYKDKKYISKIQNPINLKKHHPKNMNITKKIFDMKLNFLNSEEILDAKSDLFR